MNLLTVYSKLLEKYDLVGPLLMILPILFWIVVILIYHHFKKRKQKKNDDEIQRNEQYIKKHNDELPPCDCKFEDITFETVKYKNVPRLTFSQIIFYVLLLLIPIIGWIEIFLSEEKRNKMCTEKKYAVCTKCGRKTLMK